MRLLGIALSALLALAVPAFAAGDAAAGAVVFNKCTACHSVGENARNRIGPVLNGVVGRPPASVEGFNYSQPMKDFAAKNPAWTVELLGQWLHSPRDVVPGSRMSFGGLGDQSDIDNVIAYLQTFGPDGKAAAAK